MAIDVIVRGPVTDDDMASLLDIVSSRLRGTYKSPPQTNAGAFPEPGVWHPVASPSIRRVKWERAEADPTSDVGILSVDFTNGAVYEYLNATHYAFKEMLKAESVGHFFNSALRDRYQSRRVTEPWS